MNMLKVILGLVIVVIAALDIFLPGTLDFISLPYGTLVAWILLVLGAVIFLKGLVARRPPTFRERIAGI